MGLKALDLERDELEGLIYEKRDHVAYVTLNNPERGNAVSPMMHRGLKAIWDDVRDDPSIRVAIVTGAGERHFCTGADVGRVAAEGKLDSGGGPLDQEVFWTPRNNGVWKPTICAINGLVAGAGLHFVGECDINVAADHAAFTDPHVNVAIVSSIDSINLVRRIPLGSVARLALCGRSYRMPVERAYQIGLVDEVVPLSELMAKADEIAAQICEGSPHAVSLSLQCMWNALEQGRSTAQEYGWALARFHRSHPDAAEGPPAFAEKRPPQWVDGA